MPRRSRIPLTYASLALAATCTLTLPISGQSLLQDIQTGNSTTSSSPHSYCEFGGLLYFLTFQGSDRRDTGLWRTDGTVAGTALVTYLPLGGARELTAFGNAFYFQAMTPGIGAELWRSDGTSVGTKLLLNINPGREGSWPTEFVEFNGHLYFAADDGVNGRELWRTDGTIGGTVMWHDIHMTGSSSPQALTVAGTNLLFTARDGTTGRELWKTDGRTTTTAPVLDINPNGDAFRGIGPFEFAVVGNKAYFKAFNPLYGDEPWVSDGMTNGTMVIDILPGTAGSMNSLTSEFEAVGNTVYCTANDTNSGHELWRLVPNGPSLVRNISPGAPGSDPRVLTAHQGNLYFIADDGANGIEMWTTNCTSGGACLLPQANPNGNSFDFRPQPPVSFGSWLYYAPDYAPGRRLWRTDGTTTGPVVAGGGVPRAFGYLKELGHGVGTTRFVFGGSDALGTEPWVSDSTLAAPARLVDANRSGPGSSPIWFEAVGKSMFFPATTTSGAAELFVSNGTAASTRKLLKLNSYQTDESPHAALGDLCLFAETTRAHGLEPWRSDGTVTGTYRLHDIEPGVGSSLQYMTEFVRVGEFVLFVATSTANGSELWKTNGMLGGTQRVGNVNPGPGNGVYSSSIVQVGNRVYFIGDNGTTGQQLWFHDVVTGATTRVTMYNPPLFFDLYTAVALKNRLFFFAANATSGCEPWISNGTSGGTFRVRDINPGSASSVDEVPMVSIGSAVLFRADDGQSGFELWSSDGTYNGTTLVCDIWPGPKASLAWYLDEIVATGNRAFFFADDGTTGVELWTSDGQKSGTRRLEVHPGPADGIVDNYRRSLLAPLGTGPHVVFSATDGTSSVPRKHGVEVWVSDGTQPGTVPMREIAPLGAGSWPVNFARARSTLYFAANDSVTGVEPWIMPLAAAGAQLAESFGIGCPGTRGRPAIGSTGAPKIGNATFAVELANARPTASAALLGGFEARIPLSSACQLYVQSVAVGPTLTTTTAGTASLNLGIPNSIALVGAEVAFQWIVIDPQGAFQNAIALSDGLFIVVGR